MSAKFPKRRTENSSNADRSWRENQELFTKKATENDQTQQKHLPFKMKSSYGKIVYLANKIQSDSFILCSPFILLFEVAKSTMKCLSKIHLEQGRSRHRVQNIRRKPNKDSQGGLEKKRRVIQPKNFASGGPRCPVQFFKTYLARRPEEMRNNNLLHY